jgi:hypothetical protein
MDLEIQMLESQIEIAEDTEIFLKLNTNFEIKVMTKLHISKCKCEECLHKALEYVVKGTGLDPNSEK